MANKGNSKGFLLNYYATNFFTFFVVFFFSEICSAPKFSKRLQLQINQVGNSSFYILMLLFRIPHLSWLCDLNNVGRKPASDDYQ